ncbi:MAG: HEAT repeat domain-containing protein [Planctomycetes bacterium]|nr:HEAT repeat domain-containing protein [Planctomycetota bacterium]
MAALLAVFPHLRIQERPFEAWPDLAAAAAQGEPAVPWLLDGLGSGSPLARAKCTVALGLVGDARAVGPLREALGREPENLGRYAAVALARLGDGAGRAVLYRMLSDPEPSERWRAAAALIALGDDTPVSALIADLATPPTPWVHETPRRILERRVGGDLGEDPEAWRAWWELGVPSAPR